MILTFQHIYQPLNPILIEFGPLTVYKYAFMIMFGVMIALIISIREGQRLGIDKNYITDGLLIILPLAIIGARLWYILFSGAHNFRHFFPFKGLAIHGGIFVAIIGTIIYARRKQINVFKLFDLLAPGLLIGQIFGRWGNFFNQEAHGGVIGGINALGYSNLSLDAQRRFLTDTLKLPNFIANQMYGSSSLSNDFYYHPTFLYESVWNIIGLIFILVIRRTKWLRLGDLIGIYLMWYSFGRFFIESLRTDALMLFDTSIRIAQVISVLLFIVGLLIIIINRYKNQDHYYKHIKNT